MKMQKPQLNIPQMKQVTKALQKLLADEYVLYTKTQQYHWNVVGPQFHSLHVLYEEQYTQMQGFIDQLAERIRNLGEYTTGTLSGFISLTRLQEDGDIVSDGLTTVQLLLKDHEQLIRDIRKDITLAEDSGDQGTADLLTALIQFHEKSAWMLRSTAL